MLHNNEGNTMTEYYKQKIITMLDRIDDKDYLSVIYTIIKKHLERAED